MNKRRLTSRRVFNNHTYRFDEPKISICFDSCHPDEEPNALIIEAENNVLFENGKYIAVKTNEHHYIVGEVANRLYEYEQLGYSPEELKEIIDDRKKLKERLNSLYGTSTFSKPFAETRSDAWVNTGVNIAEVMEKLKKSCAKVDYCKADVENTLEAYGRIHRMSGPYPWGWNIPEIDNVIFNDPATIIFWKDGTKTIVKAEGEDFDPEKGLAMAISKKALGNKGNYFDIFKKWTKNYKPGTRRLTAVAGKSAFEGFAEGMRQAAEAASKLAMETRDDAVEGNLFLASDELRGVLNSKRATKNDMVKSIRYALERLDHARLHFIKKKEN
jgi:tetratricopeptide (TPR) repeat protein